ncbi:hypothetical protein D3C71_934330 [compost metagenome]
MAVGDQVACLGVDASPQHTRLDLVRHRPGLVHGHRQLPGGNHRAGSTQDVHFNGGDIALALLVDLEHRDHHFLQRCAAVYKTAPGALQTQAVDRLGNLDFDLPGKTQLFRREAVQAG